MKKLALVLLASLVATAANAQSFSTNGRSPSVPPGPPPVLPEAAQTITQSTNPTTVAAANSVSCNGGSPSFFHTDNSYYRAFTLSTFPVLTLPQFRIDSVTIGIETANAAGTGTTQPVTVRLYKSTTNPPTVASLGAAVATESLNVADQTNSLLVVPITAQPVYLVAGEILVVEVFTPNGQTAGHSFFLGSNALGQSGPSFLLSVPCGVSEITNTASIGFANMHIVMSVSGNTQTPVELIGVSIE